ncbi:MAG: hypothetical protein UT05_C0014G0021 [Parcubacteria group bacterium GW2011_GWF2_38_76]|nr:MAG: hypothetical protein UT05_C0014G0021 [Parcubacteria group bacterium GW2011_GWF2_38_76]HBM46042.1 hypothetical protein [Patescibacteria group bacterium]
MTIYGYLLLFGGYFVALICLLISWIILGIMAAILKNIASKIFKGIYPIDIFETEENLRIGPIALIIVVVDIILHIYFLIFGEGLAWTVRKYLRKISEDR